MGTISADDPPEASANTLSNARKQTRIADSFLINMSEALVAA